MRRLHALGLAVFTVAFLGATPTRADAGHPHFNDQGTLPWYRTLPEAQAAARQSGKLIFIESGRLQCGSCRKLVERVLPQEPIRSRLAAIAVGVADDCDQEGTAAMAVLNRNLPGAQFLPLVGFLTPDLVWVTGWCGGATPESVLAHLQRAEAVHARLVESRRAAAAPRTPPSPAGTGSVAKTPRAGPAAVVPKRTAPVPPAPAVQPGATRLLGRTETRPTPPAGGTAVAPVSGSASDKGLVTRARACAAGGDWGGVLRCYDEAGEGRDPSALATIAPLAERAHLWALRQMDDAEKAAVAHQYQDALRCLSLVQRSLAGTSCPVAVDAERGQRAIERLVAIEQGSPDGNDVPEALRRKSYQEFRGSRWAPLFRSTGRG